MPLGEWVTIAVIYDSVNNMKHVYINGARETSVATNEGSLAVDAHNLYIGARATSGNTGPERFFSGSLDEMRICSRALSMGEVRYLARRP